MSHEHTATHEHGPAHPARTYVFTLVALLILTCITVAAAGIRFEAPSVNVVIALSIATIKATLVGLFFMHLKYDKPVNAIIIVSGFVFVGLLLMFSFTDVLSREELQPTNLKVPVTAAAPAKPAAAPAAEHK